MIWLKVMMYAVRIWVSTDPIAGLSKPGRAGSLADKVRPVDRRALHLLLGLFLFLSACSQAGMQAPAGNTLADLSPSPAPSRTPGPQIDFAAKDLEGNAVQISDYAGEVVLVTFWASWCTACKEEMPILDSYYQQNRDQGFTLIGINTGEDAATAADFIEEMGYTFIAWSDPAGNELLKARARGLPFSVLLDREGRQREAWYGAASLEYLEMTISPLLTDP